MLMNIVNKIKLGTMAKSPEILMGVGVVAIVGGVVLACKATKKNKEIEEEAEKELEEIDEEEKAELVGFYIQTAGKYIKNYAPATLLLVGGISCLVGSNVILRNRLIGTTAAYKLLDVAYNNYRNRVIKDHGKDYDYKVRRGISKQTVEVDENGEVAKEEDVVEAKISGAPYSLCFDKVNSKYWSSDKGYNQHLLQGLQRQFNDKLILNKVVFLNEVLEALGADKTQEGQLVGWVANPEDGDGFIDFGFDQDIDFVEGREASVWLDFNVDGLVYDLL